MLYGNAFFQTGLGLHITNRRKFYVSPLWFTQHAQRPVAFSYRCMFLKMGTIGHTKQVDNIGLQYKNPVEIIGSVRNTEQFMTDGTWFTGSTAS